ncbi:hypothetical protein [Blastochloris tepida]|uniref:Uncharacterized protein n=1 Tax=Blastochloris tepida TaxID=2233851 RepID=A0A348G1I9_9HYPH|nr:hypothetical protein [Blastochloris tepida]BBF93422.1 hypothetical protein BLTE_21070 [Blastochloris tepida]
MTEREEKSRESKVRRQLQKCGYRLHKTPARSWLRKHYGAGYMITLNNTVVSGCSSREYDANLEDVELFVSDLASHPAPTLAPLPADSSRAA